MIIRGAGKGPHKADAKLATSLKKELGRDYEVHYPVIPNEASPDNPEWEQRLMKEVVAIGNNAIHRRSLGQHSDYGHVSRLCSLSA